MRHIPRPCVLCAGTVNQIPPLARLYTAHDHSAFYGHRNRKVVVFTINLVCLIYLLQVHAVPSYGLCEDSTWIAEGCCAQQTGGHRMDGSNCLIEYYPGFNDCYIRQTQAPLGSSRLPQAPPGSFSLPRQL
jgi:hypothetical protein